jgi:hypothetical protein
MSGQRLESETEGVEILSNNGDGIAGPAFV